MEIEYGFPFRGEALASLKAFLSRQGLAYDDGVEFTVCLREGGEIAASGSLEGRVIKCVAADAEYRGEGASAIVLTELIKRAAQKNIFHLFLFTKPENGGLFGSLGFYPVMETEDILLMENKRRGIEDFIARLKRPSGGGDAGAIVANCNPFTRGHLYLVEQAAAQCGVLHLFILSEDKSEFPQEARREMAEKNTAHLPNVLVQLTGPYLVSAATFPDYFLKDHAATEGVKGRLDLCLFAKRIAPALGITRRFVGEEPFSPVTAAYNALMREMLPPLGIAVTEIPRLCAGGEAISASRVRALLAAGDLAAVKELVPPAAYDYIALSGICGIAG